MRWLGWAGGFALALAIGFAVPLGLWWGLLLGFGLPLLGLLIGMSAERHV